ncbi:MAG: PilZ domain-containing protein [Desulfopila sp.]
MPSESELLQNIPDAKPVRVFIPIIDTIERYRVSGILQKVSGNAFQLLFKAGALPTEAIDGSRSFLIGIDLGGPNLSIEAKLVTLVNDQVLDMVVEHSVSHAQMREFFRVDATTSVISSSFRPEFSGQEGKPWSIRGKTIDISGCGILVKFGQAVPEDQHTKLEIALSGDDSGTITTIAHPVRSTKVADDHYEVAYQFDEITTEDRDIIIGYCLLVQRLHLRLKVQVRDGDNKRP